MTTVLQLLFKRTFIRQATRWLLTILIISGLAVGGFVIWQRYTVPRVTVTEVVTGSVVQAFYATGTLLPHREYAIKANVEGTLQEVLVDKGSVIEKGQTLARVYVEEYTLKRTQAEADLTLAKQLADPKTSPVLLEFDARIRAAEKQWEIAKREYDRLAQIRETSGRTISELDRAEEMAKTTFNAWEALKSARSTKLLELQRDVTTSQAQLDIAAWHIDQQTITSPIDGVVLDWPASKGTRVKLNDILMTVADVRFDELVMRTQVDEEDKTRVLLDQLVHMTLYAYPERVFQGRVKQVYPKADPLRRTFEVDVRIEDPDPAFAPGMTGELAFVVASKDEAQVIPSQGVQSGKVWTVRDGKLEITPVTIGLRSIQRTEILSGLTGDDEVVVSPIGNLQPGVEVQVNRMDPVAAAGLNQQQSEQPTNFKGFGK